MILKELVSKPPVTAEEDSTISFACKIMKKEGVGSLLITEGEQPKGIVTERDIVYAIADDISLSAPIKDIMTTNLVSAESSTDVSDAALLMTTKKIRHLIVLESGRIIGVVSLRDVARALGLVTADLSIW